jgi:hypothetical protein
MQPATTLICDRKAITVTLKALRFAVLSLVLFSQILSAQVWSDWAATTKNTEMEYRSEVLPNMRQCYMQFRDTHQGKGNTTFDADVTYQSSVLTPDGHPIMKKDTEHIVTTPTQVGNARIPECTAITEIAASFVQHH